MTRQTVAVIAPDAFSTIGESSRLITQIGGRSLLSMTLDAVAAAGITQTICVGSGSDYALSIKEAETSGPVVFLESDRHSLENHVVAAMAMMEASLEDADILFLAGNQPFLTPAVINQLTSAHKESGVAASVATGKDFGGATPAVALINDRGQIAELFSAQVASTVGATNLEIVDAHGPICISAEFVSPAMRRANPLGATPCIEDLIPVLTASGNSCKPVDVSSHVESLESAESSHDLLGLAAKAQKRKLLELIEAGVCIENPDLVHIEPGVEVGEGTVIKPFTYLAGRTKVGKSCFIGPHVSCVGALIADGETVAPFEQRTSLDR